MSNRLSGWGLAVRVAFLAVAAAWAPAQTNPAPAAAGPDISGNRLESGGISNWTKRATGNVWVRYADHELHADEVDINESNGAVRARGHVELFRKGMGRWVGDELNYNYKTKEGLSGAGEVKAGQVTVLADETRGDKADGTLQLKGARMSTCTNDPARWHYWVAADGVRYKEHDRITAYDATVWFEGLPLFWTPYLTRDINDPFGPRLFPGFRSGWGAFLLSTYTHPLGPPGLDGNVMLDYRTARGLGYGYEVDWRNDVFGAGRIGFYAADDNKANDPKGIDTNRVDRNRWRVYLEHQADPTPTDQVLVRAEILSDLRMDEDFFPAVFRENSQPDNYFAYTHRGLDYAAGVGASGPLNQFYDGVIRVPEAWVDVLPQEIFPASGLYYESTTRGSFLRQQWAANDHTGDGLFEPYTFRLDSRHELTYPMQAFDFLNIVPRAAYRYTFYTHLADAKTNLVRNTYELGVESSFRAYGDYGAYRHVVQPYVNLACIPGPNVGPSQNFFFDRSDGPRDWSDQFGLDGMYPARRWAGVRPGVRNEVQVKEADGRVRTIFDWDAFVAYRFSGGGESGSNGLALFGSSIIFRPVRGVRLQSDILYDTKGDRVDSSDTRLVLGDESDWQFEFDYYQSQAVDPASLHTNVDPLLSDPAALARAELLRAAATHRFNPAWSGNVFVRYDLENRNLDEVGGYAQYELDCLSFRLATGFLPAFTRSDGTTRAADFRVGLELWIKALQPDQMDKMRGWGGDRGR